MTIYHILWLNSLALLSMVLSRFIHNTSCHSLDPRFFLNVCALKALLPVSSWEMLTSLQQEVGSCCKSSGHWGCTLGAGIRTLLPCLSCLIYPQTCALFRNALKSLNFMLVLFPDFPKSRYCLLEFHIHLCMLDIYYYVLYIRSFLNVWQMGSVLVRVF